MTVPPGTPKNLEWADRMRQAILTASSNVGSLEEIFRPGRLSGGEAFNGLKNALSKLDVIADEIAAFDRVTEQSGLRTFLDSLKVGDSLEDAVEAAGGAIVEASVCNKCEHPAHGFETEEFSVICRFVDPDSIVDDEACQCKGM